MAIELVITNRTDRIVSYQFLYLNGKGRVARTIYRVLTYSMATVSNIRPPHNQRKKWAGPEMEKYLKLKNRKIRRHRLNKIYIPAILYTIDMKTGSGSNLKDFARSDIIVLSEIY
jgi:hypothetical protein